MSDLDCTRFGEMAPELALGLLAGSDRAGALGHLAACPACRHHLEKLLPVADALLLLVPPVEPALGFESRLMTRLTSEGDFSPAPIGLRPGAEAAVPPRPDRRPAATGTRRRWVVAVALAAALVVVAGVAGLRAGRSAGTRQQASAAGQLATRAVVVSADDGRSVCRLVAFVGHGGQPARLVIALEEPGEPAGTYQVLAEPVDGHPPVLIGVITVTDGQGTLTAAIPAGAGPVGAVRVMDSSANTVRYRATFAAI